MLLTEFDPAGNAVIDPDMMTYCANWEFDFDGYHRDIGFVFHGVPVSCAHASQIMK